MGKGFKFDGIEPGQYMLEFVNGITRVVDVVDYICYSNGGLMYLLAKNDIVYNFNTVISFEKKVEDSPLFESMKERGAISNG